MAGLAHPPCRGFSMSPRMWPRRSSRASMWEVWGCFMVTRIDWVRVWPGSCLHGGTPSKRSSARRGFITTPRRSMSGHAHPGRAFRVRRGVERLLPERGKRGLKGAAAMHTLPRRREKGTVRCDFRCATRTEKPGMRAAEELLLRDRSQSPMRKWLEPESNRRFDSALE